jgi:hypothetical protein
VHDRHSLFRMPAEGIVQATNPATTLDPSYAVGREDRGEVSRFCRASLRAGVARLLARSDLSGITNGVTEFVADRPQRLPVLYLSCKTSEKGRADERTRTADLVSLRVIGHALRGVARGCKSPISRRLLLLRLAPCCTVLRSRWCQSGVKRTRISRRSSYFEPVAVHISSAATEHADELAHNRRLPWAPSQCLYP